MSGDLHGRVFLGRDPTTHQVKGKIDENYDNYVSTFELRKM